MSGAVNSVQLDGLVILKIIKHCRESPVCDSVSGHLLGLDVQGRLEVTGCFAMPTASPTLPVMQRPHWHKQSHHHDVDQTDDEAAALRDDIDYQLQMMKLLREVNVDSNSVGWYQSLSTDGSDQLQPSTASTSQDGNLLQSNSTSTWSSIIATQYDYQCNIPNSVCIVYDPFRTQATGQLAIRAYRLTDAFMQLYGSGDLTREAFAKSATTKSDNELMFEEIPIKLHNSHLVHAFLYEVRMMQDGRDPAAVDRLSMGQHDTIAHDLSTLGDHIHDYAQEQGRYQFYQRTMARHQAAGGASGGRNVPTAPSRLDTFLVSHQMRLLCEQINQQNSAAYTRYFVSQGLNVKPPQN
jgi:translation initiation factor 3 subunit H